MNFYTKKYVYNWFKNSLTNIVKLNLKFSVLTNVPNSYLLVDNSKVVSTKWILTDYILLSPNTKYILKNYSNLGGSAATVIYDINKQYVRGLTEETVTRSSFTTGGNEYYARISFLLVDLKNISLVEV